MKTSSIATALTSALLALCNLGSQAAEPVRGTPLTRAEVRAELLRARAAGELPSPADVYGPALTQALNQAASPGRPGQRHTTTAAVVETSTPSQAAVAAK